MNHFLRTREDKYLSPSSDSQIFLLLVLCRLWVSVILTFMNENEPYYSIIQLKYYHRHIRNYVFTTPLISLNLVKVMRNINIQLYKYEIRNHRKKPLYTVGRNVTCSSFYGNYSKK